MTSAGDDTSADDKDPAAVLSAAIAAAQRPPVAPIAQDHKFDADQQSAETSHISGNVHAHPSLTRRDKPKTNSDYFIKDDPLIRRCDPAFGAGFEFS